MPSQEEPATQPRPTPDDLGGVYCCIEEEEDTTPRPRRLPTKLPGPQAPGPGDPLQDAKDP